VRREVLFSILIEFGTPLKLVRLIKMCVNETYSSKIHIGTNVSDAFPIQNGLKQRDDLSPLLFNFALRYTSSMFKENEILERMEHISS
jgi:hypothetical protein